MAPSDILPSNSNSSLGGGFAFATCYPTSNAWLRRDVARSHPELRLAFSAPGLVTWKGATEPNFSIDSPLAVIAGAGVGRATNPDDVVRLATDCANELNAASLVGQRLPVALHVFHTARDLESTEDEATLASWLDVESKLRASFAFASGLAVVGAPVVDVVHLRDKPGTYFVGWHRQRADRPATVGGVEAKPLPLGAPSRAYSKAWELLRLGELKVRRGECVVELGAAPGGGTMAWLELTAAVTAVDPAQMSDVVAELAARTGIEYRHVQKSAGDLEVTDLPARLDYLYSDMNLAPAVVLRYLERVCGLGKAPRRAILMNLKVNDEKVEGNLGTTLTRIAAFARRLGCEMRVAQLPSHRKEVGVVLRRINSANAKGKNPRQ